MRPRAANIRTLLSFPLVALGSGWLLAIAFDAFPLATWAAPGAGVGSTGTEALTLDFPQDGTRLELITQAADDPELEVRPAGPASNPGAASLQPLMGRTERKPGRLTFIPALPFVPGRDYQAEWTDISGRRQRAAFKLNATAAAAPTVRLEPQGAVLPANALKIYLHFSQPMEQGVFLDRLRLTDGAGREILGPFRETELWSPDGKRLTVWFHPGRQKTGVNLNTDEGPVLRNGQKSPHTLYVAATWRSTQGVPIGREVTLPFQVGPADHQCPAIQGWQVTLPNPGTSEPVTLRFDEPLDPAMLHTALSIRRKGSPASLPLHVTISPTGTQWSALPQAGAWQPGHYELHADPELEDLAGNSLVKPFEVDLSTPNIPEKISAFSLPFTIP